MLRCRQVQLQSVSLMDDTAQQLSIQGTGRTWLWKALKWKLELISHFQVHEICIGPWINESRKLQRILRRPKELSWSEGMLRCGGRSGMACQKDSSYWRAWPFTGQLARKCFVPLQSRQNPLHWRPRCPSRLKQVWPSCQLIKAQWKIFHNEPVFGGSGQGRSANASSFDQLSALSIRNLVVWSNMWLFACQRWPMPQPTSWPETGWLKTLNSEFQHWVINYFRLQITLCSRLLCFVLFFFLRLWVESASHA